MRQQTMRFHALLFALVFAFSAAATPPPSTIRHVIVVILENEDAKDALQQPFLKKLAKRGTYLNQHYAIRHPSQPNYIAMVSGSTHR
ncbi:MAG: hypothetical protein ACXW29_14350, partial [Thermoanaerobaculia bacterium]